MSETAASQLVAPAPVPGLGQGARAAGEAIRDWLIGEARLLTDSDQVLARFCEMLNDAGVPVDRATVTVTTLHAELAAISRFWVKGEPVRREAFAYRPGAREQYERSPFFHVHQTRQPLSLWLPTTPDDRFGIVPALKEAGYVHYFCYPIFFSNGDDNGIAFATRAPEGFSPEAEALLRHVLPAMTVYVEIIAGNQRLNQVLSTYVGNDPRDEILAGSVHRGQVKRIRSAVLFADMRGYTRRTSDMEPEAAANLLNDYFDCLVPPIEAEGGEVLKYMGDGLLAIFRDHGDDTGGASQSALAAARAGLDCIAARNEAVPEAERFEAGIALHHGEVAYGNVGSGSRLDFTVVGRDVNVASRVAKLNKALGEPLLMTRPFADHLWTAPVRVGAYAADGLDAPIEVFRP